MAACETRGPGDALPEQETAKKSTIGVPRTTAAVSKTESAADTHTEASSPVNASVEPSGSAADETSFAVPTVAITTEAPTETPYAIVDTDYEVKSKLTDDMYDAAAARLGSENTFRLANVVKKAQAGEPVTIVMLGSASLAGDGSSKPEKSTEALLDTYWKEVFPASRLTIARDTQSADDPYFAIHRAARFVALNPDLVLIDYSAVDDGSADMQLYLESLVRRYMTCDSQPAVLLLYIPAQMQQDEIDSQRTIGVRYRLPMISFGDAIAEGLEKNVISDRSEVISASNRLTDAGHAILSAILERYFNTIRAYIRSDKFNTSYVVPAGSEDASRYSGSHIADNETVRPSAKSGISKGSAVSQDFPNGWSSNSAGFEITFKITSRNLGILYRVVPDAAGAIVDVFVDGNYVKTFSCGDTELSAPCDRSTEIYATGAKATHIVTLRQKSGTAGSFFALLALLVS